jgi:hypothetical protein
LLTTVAAMTGFVLPASAQLKSYTEYQFIFNGFEYVTNGTGNIQAIPITDQTLLSDPALLGGITNLSSVAIVYHIGGGAPMGGNPPWDTIDIISTTNGAVLATDFGIYFGSDGALGRTAVTNSTATEERRIDYLYAFKNTAYTVSGSDSIGAAFVTKHFLSDGAGNTNTIIEGTMGWDTIPHGTNVAPIVCTGTFTLGKPLF